MNNTKVCVCACVCALQTFAANHRLTSEDGELFPSREGSFVRGSGASFGGRSAGSFTGRTPSRTAGPPNLQRFSGALEQRPHPSPPPPQLPICYDPPATTDCCLLCFVLHACTCQAEVVGILGTIVAVHKTSLQGVCRENLKLCWAVSTACTDCVVSHRSRQ